MNEPILIATAGHVDHGKSTLVRCLTGTDPDRWQEEKDRGITIDLGYAHSSDGRFSFIDVPGHEKFIHNMLAGIGSIDAVLFIIAADESIMPQTREHALALRYLGVSQIAVVLTKIDMVSEDLLELLEMEVDEWMEENGWCDAPRVQFSSKQPETTDAVLALLESFKKKKPSGSKGFRLSVDRVFTSPGTGTVITGTVDRGYLNSDEQITILPDGITSRIRGLQVHGKSVKQTGPHTRLAMNLGDIHYKDLGRGDSAYTKMFPEPARKALVRLNKFRENWAPSNKHYFHLHHLAAHRQARMVWQEGNYAVIEMNESHDFWALDRGLFRDGSPLQVISGFEVLLPNIYRTKARQIAPWLEGIDHVQDIPSWQAWFISKSNSLIKLEDIVSRCGEQLAPELIETLQPLNDELFVAKDLWQTWMDAFKKALNEVHQEFPIYDYLSKARVLSQLSHFHIPEDARNALVQQAIDSGMILLNGERIKLATRRPRWTPPLKQRLQEMLGQLKGPLPIVDLRTLNGKKEDYALIESMFLWEKYLVSITPDLMIHHEFLNRISAALHKNYSGEVFTIAELKTMFNFSRKYAIPLLEYLDKTGCTKRMEEGRLWIARDPLSLTSSWTPPE